MTALIYDKSTDRNVIAESNLFKYNHIELSQDAKVLAKFAFTFNLTAYISDVDCLKILKEMKVGNLYYEPQMEYKINTFDFPSISIEFDSPYYSSENKGRICISDNEIFEIEKTSDQSILDLQWHLMELHRKNIKAHEQEMEEENNVRFDTHSEAFQLKD